MANALTISINAMYRRGAGPGLLRLLEVANKERTITSNLLSGGIQNIGTSAEAIGISEISSEGWACFENKDDTNYVEIGWDASGFQSAFILYPGDVQLVRLNPARTWQARANTAAVDLYYYICGAP